MNGMETFWDGVDRLGLPSFHTLPDLDALGANEILLTQEPTPASMDVTSAKTDAIISRKRSAKALYQPFSEKKQRKRKPSDRKLALQQLHALLREHPSPTETICAKLWERYRKAIHHKFGVVFKTRGSMTTAHRKYENNYGEPYPDVPLDPVIDDAFIQSGIPQETKEHAVKLVNACLTYKSDFGVGNYIDIACSILGLKSSLEKREIAQFYTSNNTQYPPLEWTLSLQGQVDSLMQNHFSEALVDEILGQYVALLPDPMVINILTKAYIPKYHKTSGSLFRKIEQLVKQRPLPKEAPPLNKQVEAIAQSMKRGGEQLSTLDPSEIAQLIGYIKGCVEYVSESKVAINNIIEIAKTDCAVSISSWTIQNYYKKHKDRYPSISISSEATQIKLNALKGNQEEIAEGQLKQSQAVGQYGALLTYANTDAALSKRNTHYLTAIDTKFPGAFATLSALLSAYRKDPREDPLDPDIQKAFDQLVK